MTDNPTIHITDVVTYLGCRAKWDWTSPLRQSLTMREPNKHMWLGRVVHYALAAYYGVPTPRPGSALIRAFRAEAIRTLTRYKEELGFVPESLKEYAVLGEKILRHYALWASTHDSFQIVMPEVPIKVKRDGWRFAGQTDGVLRDAQGDLWLLESKTASRIPSEILVSMSWQGQAYAWAMAQDPALKTLGKIKGVMYNFIYKSPPTAPKVLMNGGLSKRKNLRSTPEAYMAQVLAHGLDPNDYMEYAQKLHKDTFFRRYLLTYTPQQLNLFEQRLTRIVHEMLNDPFIYPVDSFRGCPGCEFVPLCKARWSGQSYNDYLVDFVRSSHYQDTDRAATDQEG